MQVRGRLSVYMSGLHLAHTHSHPSPIKKMKAFEQSASDPRRLFRSSFQLLDEERFRKVAYPTLVKLEDVIRTRLMEVERVKGRPFVLDFGDDEEDHGRESGENGGDADFAEPYAEVLRREVEARYVNETVFAFFRGAVKSAASTKASASSSASSASSTKPSTPSTKLAQRKAPPAIVVDQENLDKQAANIPATPATPQIEKVKPVVARPSTGSAASTMSTTKTKTSASIKRTPMARHQRPPVMK